MTTADIPVTIDDSVNVAILSVSEDGLQGFLRDPLGEIARRTGLPLETVMERVRAMLAAGTIRRVRQTLLATNLAQGALVAWEVPQDRLHAAFDFMFREDPFSGHVVIRTTDVASPGSTYRLWTTLKVPQGFSLEKHCRLLAERVGALRYRIMPARALFVLGVGHTRRRGLEPGAKSSQPARVQWIVEERLSDLEWRVLAALKRKFRPEEIVPDIWRARAAALVAGGRRVLDLGCGTGDLSLAVAAAGVPTVVGIDFAPAMVRVAEAKRRRHPMGCLLYTSDAADE